MPVMKSSEPTGRENNPCGHPYGLPYISGHKVSVTYGRLDPSFWCEHSSESVRLVYTFSETMAALEYGYLRNAFFLLEPHRFYIIPPRLETTLNWVHTADVVVIYVDVLGYNECGWSYPGIIARDFQGLAQRDHMLSGLAQAFSILCQQNSQFQPEYVEGIGIELASRTLNQLTLGEGVLPAKSRTGLSSEKVDQVTEYIDKHLEKSILVSELGRLVHLSPDHFARRFKTETGMSPKRYVLKRRVDKFFMLWKTGEFNESEAAEKTGFFNLSHLHRSVRKFYNCSPRTRLRAILATDSCQ
jgi:AraC-like DNA-binding protein